MPKRKRKIAEGEAVEAAVAAFEKANGDGDILALVIMGEAYKDKYQQVLNGEECEPPAEKGNK